MAEKAVEPIAPRPPPSHVSTDDLELRLAQLMSRQDGVASLDQALAHDHMGERVQNRDVGSRPYG